MLKSAIVVGTGGVANFCAGELLKRGVAVSFIESRSDGVGTSEAICRRKGIPYACLGKDSLTSRLVSIDDDTLVVSASNRYLFPEQVLAKQNLLVVNYHGALLPKYPGRNAEAWAIYNCETEGGITWHKVVKDVDAGEILIQKVVPIGEGTTSFALLREYARIAQQGFAEIVEGLLTGDYCTVKQVGERGKIMYSWMKPNDGLLDLSWGGKKISAFLRAFDYGPLKVLGNPQVSMDGRLYDIDGYEFSKAETSADRCGSISQSGKTCVVCKDDFVVQMTLSQNHKE